MRTLDCKSVARMISLYVAGELVGAPELEVAAHLAACEGCRHVAGELTESGSLLAQACTPPEFGPEFYSGIRNAVLGEIAHNRRLTKPLFFRRPWVYATSFAAVVVALLFVLQDFGGTRRQTHQDSTRAAQVAGQLMPGHVTLTESSELPQISRKSTAIPGVQPDKIRTLVSARKRPRQYETVMNPEWSGTAQATTGSRARVEPVESSTSSGTSGSESFGPAGAAQVSRIEIQTADPNIRIIWLTPGETRESEDINRDQDRQHAERN